MTDTDALSKATQQALQTTRSLGGYVVSVSYATGRTGASSLTVRVPTSRVQDAITRLSSLGTIVAQQVQIDDLQESIDTLSKRIAGLQERIARLTAQIEDSSVDEQTRATLTARRAAARAELATLRRASAPVRRRKRAWRPSSSSRHRSRGRRAGYTVPVRPSARPGGRDPRLGGDHRALRAHPHRAVRAHRARRLVGPADARPPHGRPSARGVSVSEAEPATQGSPSGACLQAGTQFRSAQPQDRRAPGAWLKPGTGAIAQASRSAPRPRHATACPRSGSPSSAWRTPPAR